MSKSHAPAHRHIYLGRKGRNKGQSVLDYAVLLTIVAAALIAMQLYVKRAVQAGIKMAADQLGTHESAQRIDAGQTSTTESQSSVRRTHGSATRIDKYADGSYQKAIENYEDKLFAPAVSTSLTKTEFSGD